MTAEGGTRKAQIMRSAPKSSIHGELSSTHGSVDDETSSKKAVWGDDTADILPKILKGA